MYTPQKRIKREVHLNMSEDVWNAISNYCETIGELSFSLAVRRLIRERLMELGFLKDRSAASSSTNSL